MAAIEEYERTCVHLIDSVSNTLKWTIGWLIVTLVFNVFLFYVNAVACDKLRKIREEIMAYVWILPSDNSLLRRA